MKRNVTRVIAFLSALIMIVTCFAGCADKGEPLMKIEDSEISVNLFKLYLSRMKGMLCSSYSFGAAATKDSFWDTIASADGTTYNDVYTEAVLDNAKTYLCALYEFDQRGLKLPKATVDEIDEDIDELIEYYADGSITMMNSILAEFGANVDVLREAFIIDAKIDYLKNEVCGANGELVSDSVRNDFYLKNYARYKQVFFITYDFVFVTDENGDEIYYKDDNTISYDKTANIKTDKNGNPVLDDNEDLIYVRIDENGKERIAYDKFNGKRMNKTDENGKVIEKYEGERLNAVIKAADEVYVQTQVEDFSYADFDKLVSTDEEHPNGYYIKKGSNYEALGLSEVANAVFDMKEGEVRAVTSENGIHIVMRYELENYGYKDIDNSDFFIDQQTGGLVFMDELKNQILGTYLEKHRDKIVIDEALLVGVDMKCVKENSYY